MRVAKTETLIVGAGPAGLAMAGQLSHKKLPFTIIEASDRIAPSWHQHYDRLHLHTVNQWSHLPHLPFPKDFPLYVPKLKLIEYLNSYAAEFKINPIFNQTVGSINKENDVWTVKTQDTIYIAKSLVIASGVNRVASIPVWEGMDKFKGEVLHSRFYRNGKAYARKRALVVGMGNTGAELALDLSEHKAITFISVRSPISVVPRDLNGRPVQVTSKQLEKLPFGIGRWLGGKIRKIYFGDLTKYGLPLSDVDPVKQLLETGKTPVIDIGTIAAIKKEKIKVKPTIDHFTADTAVFSDGSEEKLDFVLLATGYKAKVEEFFPAAKAILDGKGLPKSPKGDGVLEGSYFLGFDNYKLGGILGTICDDSQLIADSIEDGFN
ncbi:MAG: thioredoxin reductase [Saprospiraceae bacterium]|jgi:thioredoxin reductase